MYSLSVSASSTSSCPSHSKGLVEIKCRGEEKQIVVAIMHVCVCMCTCALYAYSEGGKRRWYEEKEWALRTHQPSITCTPFGEPHSVILKNAVPHSTLLSGAQVSIRVFLFLSTKLLAAERVGPPSLGSGLCQRSVFCSYFRGKALHLLLGREGNFPLKCFPSLPLSCPV